MPSADDGFVLWLMTPEAPELPSFAELLHRPAWMTDAACRTEQTEVFFKGGTRYTRARQICAGCPVRSECLSFALADPAIVGVWAGTSERQRQDMRAGRVA